jgi:hypothetical protein
MALMMVHRVSALMSMELRSSANQAAAAFYSMVIAVR